MTTIVTVRTENDSVQAVENDGKQRVSREQDAGQVKENRILLKVSKVDPMAPQDRCTSPKRSNEDVMEEVTGYR